MGKKRIAFIGQRGVPPTYGGIERYVDEILQRLPSKEVESYTYCRRHYNEQHADYTNQLFLPCLKSQGYEAFSHSLICSADTLRQSFDLVHFQAMGPSLFSFIPKLTGTKIVATIHGMDWERAKWGRLATSALKSGEWMMGHSADVVISVSKRLKYYFEEKYGVETFYIPIGFSQPKILEANEIYRKFGLEPSKYILFLNRIVPEKGAHYLIEAFNNIGRDDFKLVIAGASSANDKYCKQLRRLAGDNEQIVFTGYLTDQEVHELYSNAYLFVLPSDLEGMPAVVLEALSHKCPVLVSDIQECLDIVTKGDEEFAFVHKASDVKDLQLQLTTIMNNPDKTMAIVNRAHNFVHEEFSWDKATRMTYEVYKYAMR